MQQKNLIPTIFSRVRYVPLAIAEEDLDIDTNKTAMDEYGYKFHIKFNILHLTIIFIIHLFRSVRSFDGTLTKRICLSP